MKARLFALAMLFSLAACSSIPTSGPVIFHPLPTESAGSGVLVAALPPAPGASKLEIVEGFLHASGIYEEGYATARLYLARGTSWHPESKVSVFSSGSLQDPFAEKDGDIVLSATLVGSVDARGTFAPEGAAAEHAFGLVKEDGEWRISAPPDGLLVSRQQFDRGWESAEVYYMGLNGRLVPEPVVIPKSDDKLERVVKRQLRGPNAWLQPTVVSRPTLSLRSVTLANAIAEITLEPSSLDLMELREAVAAELVATASSLPGIRGVQVRVGETLLTLSGLSGPTYTRADVAPLLESDAQLYLSNGRQVYSPGSGYTVAAGQVSVFAAYEEQRFVTVLTDSELLQYSTDELQMGYSGLGEGSVQQLEYGPTGVLWALQEGRLYRESDNALLEPVQTPIGSAKSEVMAFSIAADGERMAALVDTGKGAQLGFFLISDGVLSSWRELATNTQGNLGVCFMDDDKLLLLSERTDGGRTLTQTTTDGAWVSDMVPPESGRIARIACSPGQAPVALTDEGVAYAYDSVAGKWNSVGEKVLGVGYSK
ncbi:MAG: GerMN domain-containing protein [Propionibacteriaceae bacterium]|jgi:hypothetical protein|nr:GerMN domain-containing protein [Propionibacteriaceae bacterium]